MEHNINVKDVINSIVNGTFDNDHCLICLSKLNGNYQDIFTKISKNDSFSSTADMLEVCGVELLFSTSNKVCSNCFKLASAAYLFCSLAKQSQGFLNFYLEKLDKQLTNTSPESQSISILLPSYTLKLDSDNNLDLDNIIKEPIKEDMTKLNLEINKENNVEYEESDNIVIVTDENGKSKFFKPENGTFKQLNVEYTSQNGGEDKIEKVKKRRKRKPMMYKACSQCPVQYRFLGKLKEHMKLDHGIELNICKICNAFMEDGQEFRKHLQTHGDLHICAKCNMVFKRRVSIINHLKWHEDVNSLTNSDKAHMCEICGFVVPDDEHLQQHYEKSHVKKYTCYYCGRMYKGEISFEMHIKKHEMKINKEEKQNKPKSAGQSKRKHTCTECNKDFVDDRSLLWHKRLHNNERPYICKMCGRGFVSLNRRNQHAVCVHSAPARRCPLCPALFHLRSMVNTHVKKVHLNTHKRRSRTSKYQNVYWKTETVPIQDLSVSIQDEILALQAKNRNNGLVGISNNI